MSDTPHFNPPAGPPANLLAGPWRAALLAAAALVAGSPAAGEIGPAPIDAQGRLLIERVDAAAGGQPNAYAAGVFGPGPGVVEYTLSGAGEADTDFESSGANFTLDATYYLDHRWSVGARQSVGLVERSNDSEANATTSLFAQRHFGRGPLRPFVGAGVGFIYGEGVSESLFGGPEAGARFYVRDNTFLYGRGSYDLLLDGDDQRFEDGRLVYSVGVGFSF